MGNKRITAKNLKIVKVDEERDLLYLRGAVPGPKGGSVFFGRNTSAAGLGSTLPGPTTTARGLPGAIGGAIAPRARRV